MTKRAAGPRLPWQGSWASRPLVFWPTAIPRKIFRPLRLRKFAARTQFPIKGIEMKIRSSLSWLPGALFLGTLMVASVGTPAWAAPASTTAAPAGSLQPAASRTDSSFKNTYQKRSEQDKQQLSSFEGGGAGLYIGGSTAAVVVLLLILIIVL